LKPLIALSLEISSDEQKKRAFSKGIDLYLQNSFYSQWVLASGGLPVFIPPNAAQVVPNVLKRVDGLLLTGGSDLDPALWSEAELEPGGQVKPLTSAERQRSAFEDDLCKYALQMDLPILGVCRGHQQLNVALGGSLYQDMERQQKISGHAAFDRPFELIHRVDLKAWPTATLPLQSYGVTSSHHQSIRKLGAGLQVLATASEESEVIEAVYRPASTYCLGVQWHPERMADSLLSKGIMHDFLSAACQRADS
jgi:putative glutamine amidotransferase